MTLCDTCCTELTRDDIGTICTPCWREWRGHQEAKDAEWWEGSDA